MPSRKSPHTAKWHRCVEKVGAKSGGGTNPYAVCTATLGLLFVSCQVFEFTEFIREGMHPTTNVPATAFFVLTGFHGAHVTVGVIMLLSLVLTSLLGRLPTSDSLTVELVGLYWHFVDVVWIVIFTVVYLLPA